MRHGLLFVAVKLADVIDLEAQLALDEGADGAALHARDRALFLAVKPPQGAAAGTPALISLWLDGLRQRYGAPRLSERVLAGQRLLNYGLVALGVAGGWATAELLLQFDEGGSPINLGYFFLTIVLGQLGTLMLLPVALGLRRLSPSLPVVGDMARLLRFLARRLEPLLRIGQQRLAGPDAESLVAAYHRARARSSLYGGVERYLLLGQGQLFGVAFNVGVLASCVRLILFSDLVFGWSTSLAGLSPTTVQHLCAWLALPFGWLYPGAVPSLPLVEHTQYFRLEGRFAGAIAGTRGDPLLVGQWWRFLVACTVTYGLLPRVLLWWAARLRVRYRLRHLPLDTPDVQRVVRRLLTPELSMRSQEQRAQGPEPATASLPCSSHDSGVTALVLYRDVPTAPSILSTVLSQDLGLQVSTIHHAGGLDAGSDEALCVQLGAVSEAVTVIAEAWEAPDRGFRDFLARLRQQLGPRRILRVALMGEASAVGFSRAQPQDVRVFRDRLSLLADPYLAIDVLQPPSEGEAAVQGAGGER